MTTFVVFDQESKHIYKTFKTRGWAQRHADQLMAKDKAERTGSYSSYRRDQELHLAVCTSEDFHANDRMVTVKNIYGKECQIRESDRGGCCDPSTERYWSM